MNSTLTLNPTRTADKICCGDQESIRLGIGANSSCVSHDMCVKHRVSCLVQGMTVAVNQQIPLDASRGRAWGFVHLRTAIITYVICASVCESEKLGGGGGGGVSVSHKTFSKCDWGTSRLSDCNPKGQHKIPQGTWTSAPSDTRQDPQASKLPWEQGWGGVCWRHKNSRLWVREGKERGRHMDIRVGYQWVWGVFLKLLFWFSLFFFKCYIDYDTEVFTRSENGNGNCQWYLVVVVVFTVLVF